MADYRNCLHDVSDELFCVDYPTSCNEFNRERGFRDPSDSSSNDNGDRPKKKDGDQGGGSAKGGGSRPSPAHTELPTAAPSWSRRKASNGCGTESPPRSCSQPVELAVYITVMQGDPDVSLRKVMNSQSYNVADPAYAAAIAAEQAKAGGSKAAQRAARKLVITRPPALLRAAALRPSMRPRANACRRCGSGWRRRGHECQRAKAAAPKRQNAVGNVLGGTGILGTDRPRLHAN